MCAELEESRACDSEVPSAKSTPDWLNTSHYLLVYLVTGFLHLHLHATLDSGGTQSRINITKLDFELLLTHVQRGAVHPSDCRP